MFIHYMNNASDIIAQDLEHIWHPCMQMKDFETCPPIVVNKAHGIHLETNLGTILDGQSSWWCKSLGHTHPDIVGALGAQLSAFEHVITANTTHPLLCRFGETVSKITNLPYQCFASDGSCAVEIALKLAWQSHIHRGKPNKKNIIALENAYHGETIATLAVSDMNIYKSGTPTLTNHCYFIQNIPYVSSTTDPLWNNCEAQWPAIEKQLEPLAETTAALIVEPIVQGAGGMLIYSADFLSRLVRWAKAHDIYVIADEIMTGIGRTGHWLACTHANVQADMVCLSKGLTAGAVPLSCVSVSDDIYQLFYSDYAQGKSFLHSHTHSGNALGLSAALATIKHIQTHDIFSNVKQLHTWMWEQMHSIANSSGLLTNIRGIGAVIAADIQGVNHPRPGFAFYQAALKKGALLRPLGNSIYWLPPLNSEHASIMELSHITKAALQSLPSA
jgi:adenosylmethionine-8-amino-7-oxononanoate aminotransferase